MEERSSEVAREEVLERLQSRGDFLKLLGAAGVGAAAGASLLPGSAEGAVSTGLEPTDFHFTTQERSRPFDLLAKNFVQLDDGFSTNTRDNYTILRPGSSDEDDGYVRIGEGTARFAGQDDYYTILKSNTGQRAPFATVVIDVASLTEGTVYAGLYKNDGNYVHAYYNKTTNTVGLEARVNGVLYEMGTFVPDPADFGASFTFAFVANENRVIALVGDRFMDIGNFRPLIERDLFFETGNGAPGTLDLRDETVLATHKNGFGASSDTGSNILIDRVRAGYFGEAGVRDPHVVQYADGTPYIKNNKLYFTLTNAGLGFFEKAHWTVWTMDLSDYTKTEQVGNIFWHNAEGDSTKVLGHHAGQIVLDEAKRRWIVLVSSWGDFGPQGGDLGNFGTVTYPDNPPVDILYNDKLDSNVDLLSGVHILTGNRHPVNDLPYKTEGKWDPGLTRIGDRWCLSYVIALDLFTDFQPALARSALGADHTQLEFVGADWGKRATEGPVIQKLGSQWRVLASCGDDEPQELHDKYPMYTLEMAFDGYLNAPHPTNIPHPMVVPIPLSTGNTKYIMITFNGTQYYEPLLGYGTHGDFIVMEAAQIMRGYAFPPR